MTTDDIIQYYVGLLILQYASLSNAIGTVTAYISQLIQDQITVKVRDAFDYTTAIGLQLTTLGTYVGAPRTVFGVSASPDWSLVPYADPSPGSYLGWAEYTDANPSWNFLQYNDLDALAQTLTDTQLRELIAFRAAVQSAQLNLGNLDDILYSFFTTYANVVDNENMTITYQHNHLDPDVNKLWSVVVLSNSLPHPAGVSFTVVEV